MAVGGLLDPAQLAQLVVDRALRLIGADGAALYYWDAATELLNCLAYDLGEGAIWTAGPFPPRRLGEGILGAAVRRRQPILVADYPSWEGATDHTLAMGVHSSIAVPLLFRDRAVGAIVAGSGRPDHFTEWHVEVLSLLAAQVGPALSAAEEHVESERRRAEVTALAELAQRAAVDPDVDRVIGLITEAAIQLIGSDYAMVALKDEAGRMDPRGARGTRSEIQRDRPSRGTGSVSRAMASGHSSLVHGIQQMPPGSGYSNHRAEGANTAMTCPLLAHGEPIGALLLGWRSETEPTPNQALAETLASFAASVLSNARAHERAQAHARELTELAAELEGRYRELRVLHRISRCILESDDLQSIVEAILDETMPLGPYDLGLIRLSDLEGKSLQTVASRGYRDPANVPNWEPRRRDAAGRMEVTTMAMREPRIVERVGEVASGLRSYRREGAESLVIIPILAGEAALGTLGVGNRTFHRFEPAEVRLLEGIGSQMGIAVQKARLNEETRSAYRELTQAQERLMRAQRLETAGRIAGQVAHDFNNLLAPLAGFPELIKMHLSADHPAIQYCDSMLESAQRMAEINEDLLSLGRRGHVERSPIDLNHLVETALADFDGSATALEVKLSLAPDLLLANGSAAQLLRLITNLVANAREAMGDRGRLVVRTENAYVDASEQGPGGLGVGAYVRLEVSDSGPGIASEIRDKIFDAFFTTKQDKRRGAGLGLSVVQAVVEDHQGYIDLQTEPGRGATFGVYLPASTEAPAVPVREMAPSGSESVLVVDDDPMQREVARELLTNLGYQVEVVASGEAAVARLSDGGADLLILDMIMPPGIDGAETFHQVRQIHPRQRAIILSGYAESGRIREAQAAGAGVFLRKPTTLAKLARAVREELDRVVA